MAGSPLTEAGVLEALRSVMEPELQKDIVTLNMVKNVRVADGSVSLTITLTTPACPLKDKISQDVRAALGRLDGVRAVEVSFDANVPRGRSVADKAPIPGVRNLIAVASGKGGVGKTTVAVNLAIAVQRMGAVVGLLDADVYGPNVPLMLGTTEQPRAISERRILPVEEIGRAHV